MLIVYHIAVYHTASYSVSMTCLKEAGLPLSQQSVERGAIICNTITRQFIAIGVYDNVGAVITGLYERSDEIIPSDIFAAL